MKLLTILNLGKIWNYIYIFMITILIKYYCISFYNEIKETLNDIAQPVMAYSGIHLIIYWKNQKIKEEEYQCFVKIITTASEFEQCFKDSFLLYEIEGKLASGGDIVFTDDDSFVMYRDLLLSNKKLMKKFYSDKIVELQVSFSKLMDSIALYRILFKKSDFLYEEENSIRVSMNMIKASISRIMNSSKSQDYSNFLTMKNSGEKMLKSLNDKVKKISEKCKI